MDLVLGVELHEGLVLEGGAEELGEEVGAEEVGLDVEGFDGGGVLEDAHEPRPLRVAQPHVRHAQLLEGGGGAGGLHQLGQLLLAHVLHVVHVHLHPSHVPLHESRGGEEGRTGEEGAIGYLSEGGVVAL